MNIARPTAVKYLKELESSGMLTKEKRFGQSTIYHATLPESTRIEAVDNLGGIPSSSKSSLVEKLHSSSSDSTLPVVQDLNSNKQENKQKNKQEGFALPPEVDPDAWKDYCEHRESSAAMRKGWSKTAKTKAANKLAQFSHAEQRAMVDKSVISGWTGLFEERNNGQNSGSSARNRQLNRYLDDIIAGEEYGKGAI
jgi:hypothetical protein